MKFTSEDLMKAMGLSVGDRVKINNTIYLIKKINTNNDCYIFAIDETNNEKILIHYLIDLDIEILPRPKRVGDLKCKEYECAKCPLRTIRCDKNDDIGNSLYYILDNVLVGADFDQEIYDLLKARLDSEVE